MLDAILDVIQEGAVIVEDVVYIAGENLGAAYENVAEGAHQFRDSVASEAGAVVEVATEEMINADDGDSFFLDMSLARNLSILPEDVVHIAETDISTTMHPTQGPSEEGEDAADAEAATEVTPLKGDNEATETKPDTKPAVISRIVPYFQLASAVIALSSIGPILDMQKGCTPTMKIFWRMSTTSLILVPFAAYQASKEGLPTHWTCPQLTTMCLSAACYATMCTSFVLALEYTAVGNAVILSNSQAILLLVAKFLVGDHVAALEAAGAFTAFAGAVFCSKDSANQHGDADVTNADGHLTLLGDLFGLLSGVAGCGYLVFAKRVRAHVGLYIFMFLNMFIGCMFVLLFMISLGDDVTFDRDAMTGVWGWTNFTSDRLPLELTMVLIWCVTFLGILLVCGMLFIPAHVLDPFYISQQHAWLAGLYSSDAVL